MLFRYYKCCKSFICWCEYWLSLLYLVCWHTVVQRCRGGSTLIWLFERQKFLWFPALTFGLQCTESWNNLSELQRWDCTDLRKAAFLSRHWRSVGRLQGGCYLLIHNTGSSQWSSHVYFKQFPGQFNLIWLWAPCFSDITLSLHR